LSPSDSLVTDEGGFAAFWNAAIAGQAASAQARAPPVPVVANVGNPQFLRSETGRAAAAQNPASNLTDQALAPVLKNALGLWATSGIDGSLTERLADIEIRIADLPDGVLGWANGNQILIDINADGFGWF